MSAEESWESPSRRELLVVFSGLMLALALAALDQNIVGTALPLIVSELGGMAQLSWVITAFMLASTATTPLYGKLSDLYGRRPLFLVSISLFLAGSMLCGAARTMLQLILFRGLQGLGAGGLMVLAQTTIGDLIPPRERGRYQGLFGAVFAACSVAGPLLGGYITEALNWRWIFYINLPVGIAALLLILWGLPPRRHAQRPSIDYPGAILLTGGTSCLLLVLSWGGSVYPWLSPTILGLALGATLLYTLLIFQELRAPEPLLPPRLFTNRIFQIATTVISLNATALMGAVVFMPLFFQLVLGESPTRSGLLMAPLMGGVITSSVVSGRLVSRFGRYKPLTVVGLGVAVISFLELYAAASGSASLPRIEAGLISLGLSLGLVMPNLTVAIQNAVQRSDLGVATSASAFFRSLGGSFGVAVSGALLTLGLQRSLGDSGLAPVEVQRLLEHGLDQISQLAPVQRHVLTEAYRQAIGHNFLAGAAVAALAFLLTLLLPEKPLQGAAPIASGGAD